MTAPRSSVEQWLEQLQTQRRYSPHTLAAYRRDLQLLHNCHPDVAPEQLTEHHIRQAVARLHAQGLQPRSLARALSAWRGWLAFAGKKFDLPDNPARAVRSPKIRRNLPKALSVEQAQSLLDRPEHSVLDDVLRCRDQAMFEVLYTAGLRLAELVSLDWRYLHEPSYTSTSWLELDNREAVISGKGSKTRRVPLGTQAVQALEKWLACRPRLLTSAEGPIDARAALFLGARGLRIAPRVVQRQLTAWAQRSGLPVGVHPHSLRHSFASHLLQSSQDLRAVQELLGHANISTTQIYTRLDFQHLASVYDQAHPRAQKKS